MNKHFGAWARGLGLAAALLAAPAAHAFGAADAGVYAVFDNKGKQTEIAYRFYLQSDKWVAEERGTDGSWTAFACKENCEIRPMAEADITRAFGQALDLFNPSCISNSNFAVCNYTGKKDPAKAGYLMVVKSPDGKAILVHLGQLAKL